MGLSSAINSGISGLQSFSNSMSVIGNNLANSNTTGFKASRTLFADLIPDNLSGSGGISQIGRGATLSNVDNIFSQGAFESTNSSTDLAIEGPGFFIVGHPDNETDYYTRAGAFRLDKDGQLTNPEGYRVQGFQRRQDDTFGDVLEDIVIDTRSFVPAQPTTEVSLTTNLNSESEVLRDTDGNVIPWDINNPTDTSHFATTSLVYDSLGSTHLVTTYFNKTDSNTWEFHQAIAASDIANSAGNETNTAGTLVVVGEGELTFNEYGLLSGIASGGTATTPVDISWPNVSIDPANLDWNNGADNVGHSIEYAMKVTQVASESVVVTQESNGYSTGSLSNISVDSEGIIVGTYSNGEKRNLAKLALAKFANNNGLSKIGKNLFEATTTSGPPDVGTSGSAAGKVFSNSLEQSTVDIADEFAKMIVTQRSFQANSKTITTTDEMLNEVINLKR